MRKEGATRRSLAPPATSHLKDFFCKEYNKLLSYIRPTLESRPPPLIELYAPDYPIMRIESHFYNVSEILCVLIISHELNRW